MTSMCDTTRHQAANKIRSGRLVPDNANTPIAALVEALCYPVAAIYLSFCPLHQLTLCPIAQSVDFPQIPRSRMLVSGLRSWVPARVPIQSNGQSDDAQSACQDAGHTLPPRNRLAVRRWLRLSSLSRRRDNAGRRAEFAESTVSTLKRERSSPESISKSSLTLSNEKKQPHFSLPRGSVKPRPQPRCP